MFSVIIPTLNEEGLIDDTLRAIPGDSDPVEVIVADGGSTDKTRELADVTARVLSTGRGRALQMNAGAAAATGDVFVFLHADTCLPSTAFSAIRAVLADPELESGVFRLRFDVETPLLRFYAFCTRFPIPQICFGDRAVFVRRSVFEEVGGFPAIPIFEDLELVRILHRRGGFRFLPQSVTTAARRFRENGALRQQLRNAYLWSTFMMGGDPHRMAKHYRYPG